MWFISGMSHDPSLLGSMDSSSECQQVWGGKLQIFLNSQCGLASWQGLAFYCMGPCQPFLSLKGSQHSSGLPSDVYQAQRNKYCLVVWVSESSSQDSPWIPSLTPDYSSSASLCKSFCERLPSLPVHSLLTSSCPFLLLPLSPSASQTYTWREHSTVEGRAERSWFPAVPWVHEALQTLFITDHLYLLILKIRDAVKRIQWPLHLGPKECLIDFRGKSLKAHIVQRN